MLVDVLVKLFVLDHALAEVRVFELGNRFADRRVLHPARKQTTPWMLHGRVRILICGDLQTFAPRFFELFDHLANASPVGLGAHFEMIHMDGNVRLSSDTERLGQLFHHIEAFAADVHAVVTAVAIGDLGHLDHLAGTLRTLGMPCRSEAQSPLFHRLRDQPVHFFLFCGIRRPLFEAAYHALHLLRRHTGSDVDRDTAAHHRVEITGKSRPVGLDAVALAVFQPVLFQNRAFERRHGLALADNIQRHALADFAFGIAVGDQGLIAVRVHVDVARRDHIAFCRDRALSFFGIDFADARDLAVFDRHVAVEPRIPRAVDQSSAVNNDVEFGHVDLLTRSFIAYITASGTRQDRFRISRAGRTSRSRVC